jgi:hypothetical protein
VGRLLAGIDGAERIRHAGMIWLVTICRRWCFVFGEGAARAEPWVCVVVVASFVLAAGGRAGMPGLRLSAKNDK